MADYPTGNEGIGKGRGKDGLSGRVVDQGLEGRAPEKGSVRRKAIAKKGAGHVGNSNVNKG